MLGLLVTEIENYFQEPCSKDKARIVSPDCRHRVLEVHFFLLRVGSPETQLNRLGPSGTMDKNPAVGLWNSSPAISLAPLQSHLLNSRSGLATSMDMWA